MFLNSIQIIQGIGLTNEFKYRMNQICLGLYFLQNLYFIKMDLCGNEQQFQTDFQNTFALIGSQVLQKYKPVIQYYKKVVIPFQKTRLVQNQSLVFQNSTLQKDKMELLSKIEKLSSENQRHEDILQRQQNKIHQLQRKRDDLLRIKAQNSILIDQLTVKIVQMQQSLNMKVQTIKIIQKDKSNVLEKYQQRNNDYNMLLANYMKDKNTLAEKLNQMNQLEESVLQKQKDLKAQQFYLKKMWEQFQDAKKNSDKLKQKQSPTKSSNRIPFQKQKLPTRNSNQMAQDDEDDNVKNSKNKMKQIVRTPLKKLFKYHQSQIYHLSYNYNGSMLSSCGGDRQVKIYDIVNLRNSVTIESNSVENIFECAVLNYGGQRLLTGGTDKNMTIYNSHNGKALHSFLGHGEKINSVAWSCVKQKCISGSEDKQIKVWDIEKASNLLSISCGKPVKYLTANTVEPVAYSGHSDGSVRVYSINQGKTPISQIKGLIDYPINSISLLSNRYQFLVSTLQGTTIYLMDMKMNKAIKKYEHKDFFNTAVQADISPSQNYIVGGNCDGYLYYWSREKAQMQKKVSAHECPVTTVKYNFMSGTLATADKQGSLIIWQ